MAGLRLEKPTVKWPRSTGNTHTPLPTLKTDTPDTAIVYQEATLGAPVDRRAPGSMASWWAQRWASLPRSLGLPLLACAAFALLGAVLDALEARAGPVSADTTEAFPWKSQVSITADRQLNDAQRLTKQAGVPISDWVLSSFGNVTNLSAACLAHDDTLRSTFREKIGPCVKLASVTDDWKQCVFHIDTSISTVRGLIHCLDQMSSATDVTKGRLEVARGNVTRQKANLSSNHWHQTLLDATVRPSDRKKKALQKLFTKVALPKFTAAEMYLSSSSDMYSAAEDRAESVAKALSFFRNAVVATLGEDAIVEQGGQTCSGETLGNGKPRARWLERLFLQLVTSKYNETEGDGQSFMQYYNALQPALRVPKTGSDRGENRVKTT